MKDRVPKYPGRVTLVPVAGQENTFDMVRADEPTQSGDPLNKNTLLKDATASLFGMGANAVPDDVFSMLSRFHAGLGNEYVWEKLATTDVVKVDLTRAGRITSNSDTNRNSPLTFTLYPSVEIVDGVIKLTGEPRTITGSYNQATQGNIDISGITDYYGIDSDGRVSKVSEETLVFGGAYWIAAPSNPLVVAKEGEHIAYLNSSDPNAYPPAVDDGFAYNRLGQLGGFAKIATGSYVGTGKCGASNKNTLTFGFEPKMVIVHQDATMMFNSDSGLQNTLFWVKGVTKQYNGNTSNDVTVNFTQSGNTFSYYINSTITGNANFQMNDSGKTYNYLAIG